MKVLEIGCPICDDRIRVPPIEVSKAVGLFVAHLIGEHWPEVEAMKRALPPVTPGAWRRIAESEFPL